MVHERLNATTSLTENISESFSPSIGDDELPSPPMDEEKLSTAQTTIDPSQLLYQLNKVNGDSKFQQRQELPVSDGKPTMCPQDKCNNVDDILNHAKLEAAKRKLHEGYKQAENAKKQRTIQVIELKDLPEQGLNHHQPYLKPGIRKKHWANGWR